MLTAVSAPGKVLLAGGYLVLDRAYTGLVFGLSARIHVAVQDVGLPPSDAADIVVRSPQFREAEWRYHCHVTAPAAVVVTAQIQEITGYGSADHRSLLCSLAHEVHSSPMRNSSNPFVETALSYALAYIVYVTKSASIKSMAVTILADNDYYSQSSSDGVSPGNSTGPFIDFGVRLQDAHKTGLGSSAALVTALTGAMLSHFLPPSQLSFLSDEGRSRLHNLSQAAHCAAQGKVGSGFDVAAAVYGTCVYRRFSPSILSCLGEPGSEGFAERLQCIVDDADPVHKWDTTIAKGAVNIPEDLMLAMCDVDCGSQTVGMVKKVLQWRGEDSDSAKALWDQLQAANELLAEMLLAGMAVELRNAIGKIRAYLREMSARSGVPIEPPEQTALLDALTNGVDGVLGGVVPGAGGYDAIVLLANDNEQTRDKIRELISAWSKEKGSRVRLLDVRGEMEGVKIEDEKTYEAWLG